MTTTSWIRRFGAPAIALVLSLMPAVSPAHAVEDAHKVGVVSFGLFGDQGVFRSEATGAARVVAGRFGTGPIDVQYNSRKGGSATIEALARSLQAAASRLDAEKDVLFLILTSHGSPDGLAIKAGRLTQTLTPSGLAGMLARTGVRHQVVVISACYSGVFIPRLANPDVLVITAADADHPSFGCEDKARWTYFGDAFFNVALRQADSLKDAFLDASALVRKRELREHFEPSNPLWQAAQTCSPCLLHVLERPAVNGTLQSQRENGASVAARPQQSKPRGGRFRTSIADSDARYSVRRPRRVLQGVVGLMPEGTYKQERGIDATKASAHLPGLDIDIVHRQSPNGDWEQVSINLRATPSFEAVGRSFETANPFTLWAQAARLMWMPWLLTAQTMMLPDGRPRILPSAVRPQQEAPPGG